MGKTSHYGYNPCATQLDFAGKRFAAKTFMGKSVTALSGMEYCPKAHVRCSPWCVRWEERAAGFLSQFIFEA